MPQYDGSIRINTDITTKSAQVQLAALENRMLKTADKVVALRDKMEALKSAKIPTQEFSEISAQIEKAQSKLTSLIAKQDQMKEEGKTAGISWERLARNIEEVTNEINIAKADMQNLVDAGNAFTLGSSTEEYSRLGQQLKYAENDLAVLNQRHDILIAKSAETQSSYTRLGEAVRNAFSTIGKGLVDIPIVAVKKGAEGLLLIFSKLGSTIKNTVTSSFKRLGSIAKNVFSNLAKNANSANKGFSGMSLSLKNILKYGLGIRSLYALVNKLRSAIKEGFSNLYRESNRLKNSVDSLKASALTLKNAFAAAFSPIVEIAIPYVQRLLDYMTKVVDAAGQIMAAITGRKTYTRAIKQTTAALKEETKASNKQLSSLDKLNNLTSQSDSDTDTGSGSMFEEVPISDKFKDIAQWLKDMWGNSDFYELGKVLGEKLKTALDNIPWDKIKEVAGKLGKSIASLINGFVEVEGLGYSIGKTFAEIINTIFTFFDNFVNEIHADSIGKFLADVVNGITQTLDWDVIYDTLTTAARKIAELLNNFFSPENLDYESISKTISNFVNTIVDSIYILATETNWKEIGESLGKAISDAWVGIDWSKAGQTVGEAFKAFFDFIAGAIEAVDWWAVGESVKDFLIGIDWEAVADAFFETIGAIWGGFGAFLGGLIVDGIDSAKEYFQGKIEEAGGDIVSCILLGIRDGLANIAEWLMKHVYEPFMEGFCKAFGIASPSKVMAEMGGFIVTGLLNGLKEKWKDITDWIQEKLRWLTDKIQSMVKSIGAAKSALTGGLGGALGNAFKNLSLDSGIQVPVSPVVAALSNVEFPAYATGQVIPRTMKQHLAWLGDNNKETEVVSPLSTIEQAVENVWRRNNGMDGGGDINLHLTVECEGYQLLQIIQKLDREYFKQHGKHSLA